MHVRLALAGAGSLLVLLAAGCPQPQNPGNGSRVTAVIGISSTSGAPPLTVTVTGAGSSSRWPGTLSYAWEFGDGTTSADMQATHTYTNPGHYRVKLTVTDSGGETGVATVDVRVRGGSTVAVITVDRDSGPAPLTVRFDGTQSSVQGDTIRDYRWDFDDGTSSVLSKPQHTFRVPGTYDVALTIKTAGGVEASTTTTITVSATQDSSLQFDGTASANLPFGATKSLTDYTLEAWIKPQTEGGNVFAMGQVASLDVSPSTNLVRLRIAGQTHDFTAAGLADTWRHLAIVVASESGTDPNAPTTRTATVYLDGAPLGTVDVAVATYSAAALIIGNGLRGKLGEVRVWSVARNQSEINATRSTRITGATSGAIGVWPLNDGTGQTLDNATGSSNGFLGSSTGVDAADPAWSSDAPPL